MTEVEPKSTIGTKQVARRGCSSAVSVFGGSEAELTSGLGGAQLPALSSLLPFGVTAVRRLTGERPRAGLQSA